MTDYTNDPRWEILREAIDWSARHPDDRLSLHSLVERLDAVDPARQWMPIEEAPKDGRLLMVWLPRDQPDGYPPYCLARYYSETCDPEFWDGDEGWLTPEGDYVDPTHYLPLPAPPEAG